MIANCHVWRYTRFMPCLHRLYACNKTIGIPLNGHPYPFGAMVASQAHTACERRNMQLSADGPWQPRAVLAMLKGVHARSMPQSSCAVCCTTTIGLICLNGRSWHMACSSAASQAAACCLGRRYCGLTRQVKVTAILHNLQMRMFAQVRCKSLM